MPFPREDLQLELDSVEVDKEARAKAWDTFKDPKVSPSQFGEYLNKAPFPAETKQRLKSMRDDWYGEVAGQRRDRYAQASQKEGLGGSATHEPPKTREEWADMAVNALPSVMGATGGMLGGIPGAAALGATGEGIRRNVQAMRGRETPATGGEMAFDALKEGAVQAGTEGLGKAVMGGIGKFLKGPGREAVSAPENIAAHEANKAFGGVGVTPGEIGGDSSFGSFWRKWQKLGSYSVFSQDVINKKRNDLLNKAMADIDHELGTLHPPSNPRQLGDNLEVAIKQGEKDFKGWAHDFKANEVIPHARGVTVDMSPMETTAKSLQTEIEDLRKHYPKLGNMGKQIDELLEDFIGRPDPKTGKIIPAPKQISFEKAMRLRSNLGDYTAGPDSLMPTKVQGMIDRLYGDMTGVLKGTANAANPRLAAAFNRFNAEYREGADLFRASLVKRIIDKDPEAAISLIRDQNPTSAAMVRKAALEYPMRYGDPASKQAAKQTWKEFQEQYIRRHILGDPERAATSFDHLTKVKERLQDIGPSTLKEVFSDPDGRAVIDRVRTLGGLLSRFEKIPVESRKYAYEVLAVVPALIGGGLGFQHGGGIGAAAGAAAGMGIREGVPVLMAKAVYNERAYQYLTEGLAGLLEASKVPQIRSLSRPAVKLGKAIDSEPAKKIAANFGRAAFYINQEAEKRQSSAPPPPTREERQAPPRTPQSDADLGLRMAIGQDQ